jgi:nucleoside-diphosphate-sugar epimerase
MSTGHVLVVGCGYLGARVARLWQASGHTVWALTRRADRARELALSGWHPVVADINRPESLPSLPQCATVLVAVGHERLASGSRADAHPAAVKHLVSALPAGMERLIYISSTGVYGQNDGTWVDEASPTEPQRAGGRACLDAERWLTTSPWSAAVLVLRLAGLYGPGRLPRLDELRAGIVPVEESAYLNLVHVDDAAQIVHQVSQRVNPPDVLNVSDGHPVERGTYLRYLAELSGLRPPRFTSPGPHDPGSRRAAGSKRVSTRRLAQRCPIEWLYPSYREGLRQAVEQGVS